MQPAIVGSGGRGMCRADGEGPERTVGHPVDERHW